MSLTTTKVSDAVARFFEWLTQWDKGRATRLDKRSIELGKKLAFKVKDFEDFNEIIFRAKFDEAYKTMQEAKVLANKFLKSLD